MDYLVTQVVNRRLVQHNVTHDFMITSKKISDHYV